MTFVLDCLKRVRLFSAFVLFNSIEQCQMKAIDSIDISCEKQMWYVLSSLLPINNRDISRIFIHIPRMFGYLKRTGRAIEQWHDVIKIHEIIKYMYKYCFFALIRFDTSNQYKVFYLSSYQLVSASQKSFSIFVYGLAQYLFPSFRSVYHIEPRRTIFISFFSLLHVSFAHLSLRSDIRVWIFVQSL